MIPDSPILTLRKKGPYSELFWSVFSRIRTESVSLRIQSEYGEIQTRITQNTDTFYTVLQISSLCCKTKGRRWTILYKGNYQLCEVPRSRHGKTTVDQRQNNVYRPSINKY